MIYHDLMVLEEKIRSLINEKLEYTGILYRLYSRTKTKDSIAEKITRKGYKNNNKQLQDIIGIRIMTYFYEDIEILSQYFSTIFHIVSYEHDEAKEDNFNAMRLNLVCTMSDELLEHFRIWKFKYPKISKYIDSTFEIQIRTTLSEGWHEVDHMLRYKCKNEWTSLTSESRLLNSIHATLEISDKALLRLFEEIAYQHYKNKNWCGMIRNKFRLKFERKELSNSLILILNNNDNLAKEIFKTKRCEIMNYIINHQIELPTTFDNIIYLINYLTINNPEINKVMPMKLKLILQQSDKSNKMVDKCIFL